MVQWISIHPHVFFVQPGLNSARFVQKNDGTHGTTALNSAVFEFRTLVFPYRGHFRVSRWSPESPRFHVQTRQVADEAAGIRISGLMFEVRQDRAGHYSLNHAVFGA